LKTIGLIGGMSWESSVDYYKIINETVKAKLGGLHSAKCILYSFEFDQIESLQHQENWQELTNIMVDAAEKLKKSGADFIVICTNTMHKMASDIEKRASIKVLHIAEVTAQQIVAQKMKKVALLGTKFTMEQDFYKKILTEDYHIEVMIPNEQERNIIHDVIYNELCQGIIKAASREKYQKIINRLIASGAEGIVLGCTEIPSLIQEKDCIVPLFNTTNIHAVAAVEFALGKK
jgi:aspartate racemase